MSDFTRHKSAFTGTEVPPEHVLAKEFAPVKVLVSVGFPVRPAEIPWIQDCGCRAGLWERT